jgi:hypothetical protein
LSNSSSDSVSQSYFRRGIGLPNMRAIQHRNDVMRCWSQQPPRVVARETVESHYSAAHVGWGLFSSDERHRGDRCRHWAKLGGSKIDESWTSAGPFYRFNGWSGPRPFNDHDKYGVAWSLQSRRRLELRRSGDHLPAGAFPRMYPLVPHIAKHPLRHGRHMSSPKPSCALLHP